MSAGAGGTGQQEERDPQRVALGKRIAHARVEAGLTQRALAQRISAASRTIVLYENGRNRPSLPTLRKIATALGTSVEVLLSGAEGPEAARAQTDDERTLLRVFRCLDAAQRRDQLVMTTALARAGPAPVTPCAPDAAEAVSGHVATRPRERG